jgi:hypothetical protein
MTLAREFGKFPSEVGRMPFSDARDFADWAWGEKPQAKPARMTPSDFRELREKLGGSNG